jgi:predicted aspartyl protease
VSEAKPLLVVSAFVNGRGPFNLAVDTGASLSVISRGVARRAKVATDGSVRARAIGAGGALDAVFARVSSVELGDLRAADLDVAVMRLTPISRAIGFRLDGVLGFNFLRRYRVTIDYPKQVLSFDEAEDAAG